MLIRPVVRAIAGEEKRLHILDPVTGKPLAPEGEDKVMTSYWRRRLRDGDVEELDPGTDEPVVPVEPAAPDAAEEE
ncbi:MAG: DUF2635 domain-containing protein [Pseudomonadota bacterium]